MNARPCQHGDVIDALCLFETATFANDAAVAYAKAGIPVFPCDPEKKSPLVPRGFHAATTDTKIVQAWFRRLTGAAVAMPTGEITGLDVIDIDDMRAIEVLEGAFSIPRTFTVATPRGGQHLYYLHPYRAGRIRSTQGVLTRSVDTRCDGGYVLIPPSQNKLGRYVAKDPTDPVPLPENILKAIKGSHSESQTSERSEKLQVIETDIAYEYCDISDLYNSPLVQEVLAKTVPPHFGKRHRQVFDLARGLKFDCSLARTNPVWLKPLVRHWYSLALPMIKTKDFDETWSDFLTGWKRAKSPLSGGALEASASKARTGDLPVEADIFDSTETKVLVGICWHLSKLDAVGAFFLSSHKAASLVGLSQASTYRRLAMLEAEGVIETVKAGKAELRVANVYRWKGKLAP